MGSDRLGSGSLAACFAPCNRLSRKGFGPPIWDRSKPFTTGTAGNARSFFSMVSGRYPTGLVPWEC
jgi:hypothetical protein